VALMDAVSIALALICFAAFWLLIEGMDRI
jgi:hypothetical protein